MMRELIRLWRSSEGLQEGMKGWDGLETSSFGVRNQLSEDSYKIRFVQH